MIRYGLSKDEPLWKRRLKLLFLAPVSLLVSPLYFGAREAYLSVRDVLSDVSYWWEE